MIDETNPHYKFAKYWESIGHPELEATNKLNNNDKWGWVGEKPSWSIIQDYRIKGDRHWELRQEWVDSGYNLLVEFRDSDGDWKYCNNTHIDFAWIQEIEYRKAEPHHNALVIEFNPPKSVYVDIVSVDIKQDQPMTEPKQLPTIIKGKKLELVDVPISTLPECLAALAAGYVLEFTGGFIFLEDDKFALFDFQGKKLSLTFTFPPFIAAYKLVDIPWWENIPESGVLCKYLNGVYAVVTSVKKEDGEMFAVVQNCFTLSSLKDFEPATDEWLESMKRGF